MIVFRNKMFGSVANVIYNADCLENGVPTDPTERYRRMRSAVEKSQGVMGKAYVKPFRGIINDYDMSTRAARRIKGAETQGKLTVDGMRQELMNNPGAIACLGDTRYTKLAAPAINAVGRAAGVGVGKLMDVINSKRAGTTNLPTLVK